MREIVNLQIGQGGNQMGKCFWESLCLEHSIDQDGYTNNMSDYQKEFINVYFDEQKDNRYKARSLLIDGDPQTVGQISASQMRNLFYSDCFQIDQCSAGNCFGKGRQFYDLIDSVVEQIRLLVENCDSLQGFQLMRSLGGGMGSGFGDTIQCKIREEYPNQIITNFCIFPSSYVSNTVVEPYNCVLSLPGLIENQDLCFCYDNRSLYNINKDIIGCSSINHFELNKIIQMCLSGTTAQWRFPSQIYNTMRKLATNMVPFPQLQFLNTGVAPLINNKYKLNRSLTTKEMVQMLLKNKNFVNHNVNQDKLIDFAGVYIFRGIHLCEQEIMEEIIDQLSKKQYYIPDNQKVYQCNETFNKGLTNTALKLENGTSVTENLQIQLQNFSVMFRRKAFIHYGFGDTEEMEFTEAQSYLTDILDLYSQYQDDIYQYQDSTDEQEKDNEKDKELTFKDISDQFVSIGFTS